MGDGSKGLSSGRRIGGTGVCACVRARLCDCVIMAMTTETVTVTVAGRVSVGASVRESESARMSSERGGGERVYLSATTAP